MKIIIFSFLLLTLTSCSTTQKIPILKKDDIAEQLDLFGFSEVPTSYIDSKFWYEAHNSSPYHVENIKNLRIHKLKTTVNSDIEFTTGDIKYIGVDNGEFGGALYYKTKNQKRKLLMEGNINNLIPIGNDLYIIEGLAYLSRGSVSVIRNYKTPSIPQIVTLLPDAPEISFIEKEKDYLGNHTITIAGSSSFMQIIGDSRLEIYANNTFWGGLYPTSMVKIGCYYIIGIRSGLAVVELTQGKTIPRYFCPRAIASKQKYPSKGKTRSTTDSNDKEKFIKVKFDFSRKLNKDSLKLIELQLENKSLKSLSLDYDQVYIELEKLEEWYHNHECKMKTSNSDNTIKYNKKLIKTKSK